MGSEDMATGYFNFASCWFEVFFNKVLMVLYLCLI